MIAGQESNTVYFSGKCNLKCIYCFHPKLPERMQVINKDVEQWIKSGKILEDMKYIHGKDLKIIALWGGEPTFNLALLVPHLKKMYEAFPLLERIYFSTNISTSGIVATIKNFVSGVRKVNKELDRCVQVEIQLSLDGPGDINDCNRVGSKADQTIAHIGSFLEFLTRERYEIREVLLKGKSTQTMDTIRKFLDESELYNYFKFYDDLYEEWSKITQKYPRMHSVTYAFPGQYTKQDGLDLTKFLGFLYEKSKGFGLKNIKRYEEQLFMKWSEMIRAVQRAKYRPYKGEFWRKSTCSVGNGDFGLGYNDRFHLCQGTFFFDDEVMEDIRGRDLISEFEKTQGYSFRNYESFVKDKWIFPYRNLLRTYRALFLLGQYNKGLHFRHYTNQTMIRQLAMAGLVDEKYLEDGPALDLFSMIMTIGGFSCVANNIWEFGLPWITTTSLMKFIGNGALDYVMSLVGGKG